MAYGNYTVSVKSGELKGSTKPNIIRIRLDSTDIETFVANVNSVVSGEVVTADKFLSHDYSLPYPEGTGVHVRFAAWDAVGHTEQMRLQDLKAGTDVKALAAALVAAGLQLPVAGTAVVEANGYIITPRATAQYTD